MTREEQEAVCFKITGSFEGRGYCQVTGNFDGAGWSCGFLQWNFGQGTLQNLLLRIYRYDTKFFSQVFGESQAQELLDVLRWQKHKAVAWANERSTGTEKRRIVETWATPLVKLLDSPHGQHCQRVLAHAYMADARADANYYHVETLRGLAFCFDVSVQNGQAKIGIKNQEAFAQAFSDRGGFALPYDRRLKALAEAVAASANPRWHSDVLGRKMLIVNGFGKFRGRDWNLQEQFGLTDEVLV